MNYIMPVMISSIVAYGVFGYQLNQWQYWTTSSLIIISGMGLSKALSPKDS